MTHLFADGGRIVKSTRTDYSEHLERDDMAAVVKDMMKEQHKSMFVALRSGQLDEIIGFEETAPPNSVTGAEAVLGRAASLLEVDRPKLKTPPVEQTKQAAQVAQVKPASEKPSGEVPYAASRPANIFSIPPTTGAPANIFGDIGLDEKSLDDAILSYLAEEPSDPEKKK